MKIAFDAKRAFRNSSGLGNYSRTLIRQLCHYYPDNQYILYTPSSASLDPDFPPLNTRVETPKNFTSLIFKGLWRSYGIGKSIRKEKPDLFHGLSNELPFNIRTSGIKSIVTIHDLIFLRFPHLYKTIDRNIYLKKFRFASENADLVIAVSMQTKKDLMHYFGTPEEKIKVVYQSGNPLFSQVLSRKEIDKVLHKYDLPGEYILSLGTLEERKNLLQLVRAMHYRNINIPLIVAGRPERNYAEKVYRYIEENKIENVYFLTHIPTRELPALYQGANLFAYPSVFEGFGIPVLEALQSGTPVIAGAGHCLEETGGPDSVYINPDRLEDFSQSILTILTNSDLRNRMITSGREYAKKFQPEITARNLMDVYESIC